MARHFRATTLAGDRLRLMSDDTLTLAIWNADRGHYEESTPRDLAAALSRRSMLALWRSPAADGNDRDKLDAALGNED